MFVTGLVLAAGASTRLGQPKQLLPYRDGTLLDGTLELARGCGFDQLLVTLGAAGSLIWDEVDLRGTQVVENAAFGSGCGSSISTAVDAVDDRADGLVLLLGDQPEVRADDVTRLIRVAAGSPLGVCRYSDGLGHPFWFHRDVFGELRDLHGDKAVWKLLHADRYAVVEVPTPGPVPIDVDTWQDYAALTARTVAGNSRLAGDTGLAGNSR